MGSLVTPSDDPIVRVLAGAPCILPDAVSMWGGYCTNLKLKHPECTVAALRRYVASAEVRERVEGHGLHVWHDEWLAAVGLTEDR